MKLLLPLTLLFNTIHLIAQVHNDCSTALLLCNKQSIHIDSVHGAGADNTELNDAPCFFNGTPTNIEYNSCWIRFTPTNSGTFSFIATPDSTNDDLDFVVFQLMNNGDCQQKQVLRCMAAGESVGISSSPCLGPTGLKPGETDTTEDAGCFDPDDNNFLAPLDVLTGETYALCIQNFSDQNGFQIEFGGTALLGCDSVVITATHSLKQPICQLHRIYPNPVATATITVDLETVKAEMMTFTLVNQLGQPVRKIARMLSTGRQEQAFPVDHLPSGAYWLQMTSGEVLMTRSVWIVKVN